MKIKIKKIRSSKDLNERIAGIGTFRITGPDPFSGERVSIEYTGTREGAEAKAQEVFLK